MLFFTLSLPRACLCYHEVTPHDCNLLPRASQPWRHRIIRDTIHTKTHRLSSTNLHLQTVHPSSSPTTASVPVPAEYAIPPSPANQFAFTAQLAPNPRPATITISDSCEARAQILRHAQVAASQAQRVTASAAVADPFETYMHAARMRYAISASHI
jgi:hypothetical protein